MIYKIGNRAMVQVRAHTGYTVATYDNGYLWSIEDQIQELYQLKFTGDFSRATSQNLARLMPAGSLLTLEVCGLTDVSFPIWKIISINGEPFGELAKTEDTTLPAGETKDV